MSRIDLKWFVLSICCSAFLLFIFAAVACNAIHHWRL